MPSSVLQVAYPNSPIARTGSSAWPNGWLTIARSAPSASVIRPPCPMAAWNASTPTTPYRTPLAEKPRRANESSRSRLKATRRHSSRALPNHQQTMVCGVQELHPPFHHDRAVLDRHAQLFAAPFRDGRVSKILKRKHVLPVQRERLLQRLPC